MGEIRGLEMRLDFINARVLGEKITKIDSLTAT